MKKVLIIGMGPQGQRIERAIEKSTLMSTVAVVDLEQEKLIGLDLDPSILRSTSVQEALQTRPEVVCVATSAPSHLELTRTVINNGVKYVMVEKPLTCSLQEATEMLTIAKQHDTLVCVDHPRRYSKNYRFIREQILSGNWGEPLSIYIQRPGIGLGCLGTHSFDLANFLLGKKPQKVTGWVDRPRKSNPRGLEFIDPGGLVVMDYGEDLKATIHQFEVGAGPMFVELNLTEARIHLDEKTGELQIIERDLNVKKGPNRPAAYNVIRNPNGIGGSRVLVEEIQMVLEDLITSGRPLASGEAGRDSIEVLTAAYVSDEKGNIPIELPLDPAHHSKWMPIT